MVDFHSHILPQIDDGSQSIKESVALLHMLKEQDIDKVAATPHFSANQEDVSHFLVRRKRAYEKLLEAYDESMPKIYLGAEVKYYEGISNLSNLCDLKIQGTNLLLIEMPFSKWSTYSIRELIDLSALEDTTILLAHIERYKHCVRAEDLAILRQYGILMQVNASYLLSLKTRREAFRQLYNREVHVLASDCHNLAHRPPKLGFAVKKMQKKFGDSFISEFNDFQNTLFHEQFVPIETIL